MIEPVLNPHETAVVGRILRITNQLEYEFGLDGWYQIKHHFSTRFDGSDALDADGNSTCYTTTAITVASWEYRTASITWFVPVAATQTDDVLTQVAIHEYVHALLAPISSLLPGRKDVSKHDEYVTECLSRVICHARGMSDVR